MGVLKALVIIVLIWLQFPDKTRIVHTDEVRAPMSGNEKRLAVILAAAVILWGTDFDHRVHPGWIGLAAGLATLLPYIGVMPVTSFTE